MPPLVSLARQSLLHDWRRFAAAVVSLAFAGLLVQASSLHASDRSSPAQAGQVRSSR
jgi:hypothetical protein